MFSLTQTGGRLPVEGHYFTYPFKETLQNACCSVFELPEGFEYLESFDKEQLRFLTPIKREKENSGRVNLKAETSYVFVPSLEIAGHKGDFFLSVYFNQAMRDVNIKRVFHPADKQQGKEDVLPTFIPEEAEKLVNQTPVWKIQLVKESLKYMITDEDAGVVDSDWEIELENKVSKFDEHKYSMKARKIKINSVKPDDDDPKPEEDSREEFS